MKNKVLTILYIISLTVFAITFSIGLPIYCRFFYFALIGPLEIVETSGYSIDVIINAYNDVLNYLTLPFTTFKTGELLYSTEGASHFYDVKKLFNLNGIALLISTAIIIIFTVLKRKNKLTYHNFLNKTPYFYSGIINILLPLLIGVIAVIDFEAVFDVFHLIMFPGKTDWLFNPKTDQIINILPIEFFACCAALIGVSLIVISVLYIIIHFKTKQKSN